jgi:predicted transglutaminase-like cysteine proteinase
MLLPARMIRLVLLSALLVPSAPPGAFAASNAPLGFQILCLQSPEECLGGGAASITLTSEIADLIIRVNSQVNRSIRPRDEGTADVWSVNVSSGDCEDYVLTKRRMLIGAGVPSSSLRLAHVRTRDGIDHAILIVKTDRSDLVLDNLASEIKTLQDTSYRIIAASSTDPRVWTH